MLTSPARKAMSSASENVVNFGFLVVRGKLFNKSFRISISGSGFRVVRLKDVVVVGSGVVVGFGVVVVEVVVVVVVVVGLLDVVRRVVVEGSSNILCRISGIISY